MKNPKLMTNCELEYAKKDLAEVIAVQEYACRKVNIEHPDLAWSSICPKLGQYYDDQRLVICEIMLRESKGKLPYAGMIVSEGTLRQSDLVAEFFATLERINPMKAKDFAREYFGEFVALIPSFMETRMDGDAAEIADQGRRDMLDALLDDLVTALEKEAPEGLYFGAHEGDGACFGYFALDIENLEQCRICGKVGC